MAVRLSLIQRFTSNSPLFSIVPRTASSSLQATSRLRQLQSHTLHRTMADNASSYRGNGDNGDDGSTEGELNAWKHRPPYKVHDNDPNFYNRYEGSCHCGKIRYQLSREKPLDAKFCHCTTCQKIHGAPPTALLLVISSVRLMKHRGTIPMGSYFPQRRHQFYPRPSRSRLV